MWREYNPSPSGRRVGDFAIRAIAKALNVDWEMAYIMVAVEGFIEADMPSSNAVFGSVLKKNGFKRYVIPDSCPACYTVSEFCYDNPEGTFVIGTGSHVVTAVNGDYYDTWDSGQEVVQYVWEKNKEDR